MAISGAIQTLTAAFSFGILLSAASGALFLYYNGHGSQIFKDGRRLVLVLFLLFGALWAQVGFFNLMVTSTLTTTCQALLVFTTMFDQIARVSIEQFFLWSLNQGTKVTAQQLVLQGILGIRLIAGGLLVGFTRPDFKPVCVARTSVLPISIVVLVLDAIIIGVSLIRVLRKERSKGLMICMVGFAVWTGTSVPMILGISTIDLIARTTVPSNGLLILVGIVTIFQEPLMAVVAEEGTTPEARSPFIAPTLPSREVFRENVGNGSPISGNNYTKSGGLFVVNPSSTPRDSPTTRFQGNFQGDTRGFTKLGSETIVRGIGGEEDQSGARGPGYRGSSGVFPSIFAAPMQTGNAAMAPQIKQAPIERTREISAPAVPALVAQPKRSLFGWSKPAPKTTVRSLAISKPVMDNNDESNIQPFARMQTIDLATAAANERERREGAAARSRMVANRPAPVPPTLPPAQEGLRRSISLKRKDPPTRPNEPMPSIPASNASGRSVDAANGSTTSASLSPGRDEVRRRSPRNANSFENSNAEEVVPNFPLTRKGTIGLPSNPRSQRATMAREALTAKPQTVMLMNEIVYDDPAMVNQIMSGVPDMYASRKAKMLEKPQAPLPSGGLKSSNSILHRPRPIRRDSEKDRALFPSEPSPNHKRSKSGSSIATRKSILRSHPGSPTELPPLPPPPTSAQKLRRLLPNDTKSMTFNEKIELLFPAPPGVMAPQKRRSSVPSLPRIPSELISDVLHLKSPDEEDHASRRSSKRSTIATFGFDKSRPNSPTRVASKIPERQTYRFSANTYRTIADEVGESWIPGIPSANVDSRNSLQVSDKRTSAQVVRESSLTDASSNVSSHDSTTFWGSIHSEIPAPVDLSKARQNARSTFIQRPDNIPKNLSPMPELEYNDQEETMTVMLDAGESRDPILSKPAENRESFLLEVDESLSGSKASTPLIPNWHRRIGDELPTFSERRSNTRSRKMPPPTPLLLNKRGRAATVVVRAAEPSPVDSPSRAIAEIQAQLKRFEEPDRGSVGSLIRHLPETSALDSANDEHGSRFKLLENLEKEMGQQENQWQQMQNNIDRDSMSVVMTPQASAPSETTLSRDSSQRSTKTPSRVLSRRARIRSSMTVRSKGQDSMSTSTTDSSDNSRASVWQQRLAEAQVEYLEKAPALLRKRSVNFLSVSKSHQLGSPTPPESVDSETDSESERENQFKVFKQPASLWHAPIPSPKAASGRMWNPPYEVSVEQNASSEPPAKNVRPVHRRALHALVITSSALWSKPRSSERSRPVVGLWGSKPVRPRSILTRRVTQRPQRKSKRITFLPDIVESPVPLPNKRDTLGIFQFPWGEQSDSAVYQPVFDPALLGHPALNANLEARSRQLEPESTDYSSSFFDDYDEEMDDDEMMDPESDDDFDETTLWEIASLLKSSDVPSKNSLLPQPSRAEQSRDIIENYDDESDLDDEDVPNSNKFAAANTMKLPIQPLAQIYRGPQLWSSGSKSASPIVTQGLPQPEADAWKALLPSSEDAVRSKARTSESTPTLSSDTLWVASAMEESPATSEAMWRHDKPVQSEAVSDNTSETLLWASQPPKEIISEQGLFTVSANRGLIQSTQATPAALNMVKAPRSISSKLPILTSSNLWSTVRAPVKQMKWITNAVDRESFASPKLMWAPKKAETNVVLAGLFSVDRSRSDYRTSTQQPAAIGMIRKPRTNSGAVSQLESTELWSICNGARAERDWISESTIRPVSPSVYSTASSGQSSPASDASSIKSTSTKASSIFSAIGLTKPSWFESRSGKKSPSKSPVDDARSGSKIPVRQKSLESIKEAKESKIPAPVKTLQPIRESRVLVSRDLFEAKALALGSAPVKKPRRSVSQQPTAPPLRQQHRPTIAVHADWATALAEAIAAGTPKKTLSRKSASRSEWQSALAEAVAASAPKKTLTRPTATKADWESALTTAIMNSRPRLQRLNASPAMWRAALDEAVSQGAMVVAPKAQRYDASVRHPVFFTEKLVATSLDVHPAAIGYTTRPQRYDVSVRHPVFFTENLVAMSADIHPAAIGYTSQSVISSMWTPSTAKVMSPIQNLWAKQISQLKQTPELFAQLDETTLRKASIPKNMDMPTLQSTTFWQPTETIKQERNWLMIPKVQPSMWAAPTSTTMPYKSALWSKDSSLQGEVAFKFAALEESTIRKIAIPRKVELPPTLESSSFWQPSKEVLVERNWLEAKAEDNVAHPLMWTAPELKATTSASALWSKGSSYQRDMPSSLPRFEEAITRKALTVRELNLPTLESTRFWQPSREVVSERNWLEVKTVLPLMWTPDAPKATKVTAALWSKENSFQRETSASLPRFEESPARKVLAVRELNLPTLESTTFWQPIQKATTEERHWLTARKVTAQTWTPKSPAVELTQNNSMWSATPAGNSMQSPDLFSHLKAGLVMKVFAPRPSGLPHLNSSELFEHEADQKSENTHWLHATSKSAEVGGTHMTSLKTRTRGLTWTAPPSIVAAKAENSNLWAPRNVTPLQSPSLFQDLHAAPWERKKREVTEIKQLESFQMWKPSMEMPESPKNWLVKRKLSKVEFRY
ncbi:hypothetical protein B0J14DRAFT_320036 [Halenospora varia]|nr:hypothetical protein B0J14DRAFT_320036 [Halenospora varia]